MIDPETMGAAGLADEIVRSGDERPDREQPEQPRQPVWRRFDPRWYGRRYPDTAGPIAEAAAGDAERYYTETGCRLGHSPNMFFDETWYLSAYPDVAAHVAAGGARSGFEHYCTDGYAGRSPHWLFDEAHYLRTNPDVTHELLDRLRLVNGYDHYLTIGDAENRSGSRFFDCLLYHQNVEEGPAALKSLGGPFERFLADDCRAGSSARVSWYFDPVWYLRGYPEVQEEIVQGQWSCALHHFLGNPTPLLYQGVEWFSEQFYGATYPDVLDAVADGAFRNTYEHFVRHGASERRRPHADVDLGAHFSSLRVQAEIERGDFADAFAHWLAQRAAANAGLIPAPIQEAQGKQLFARLAEISLIQLARTRLDFTLQGEASVSVIVVLHNQFALTMTALASLRSCYPGGIELILVDSGSRDDTRRIGRYVIGARIIRFDRNAGFVESCNTALPHVTAPAVLYLNNDVTLGFKSVQLALERLRSDPRIGAVGAKFIRTHGMLQEAGSIIWRDGSTSGYLRDADPAIPEANFLRDVDFCSGAFLMVRTEPLRALHGFDDDFRPAYYEETDLCVRLRKAGHRVVYDPMVVIHHVEFGSSTSSRSARMIQRNHKIFVEKHRDWLRYKSPPRPRNALSARSPKDGRPRILFFEDRVPQRELGSGYVRSNDIVWAMAALGYHVGVYPIYPSTATIMDVLADFPETVEVLYDRGLEQLRGFVEERSGYYDIVWIGRTHNLERLLPILGDSASSLPEHGLVLDTEAISAPRTAERARVLGLRPEDDLETMLRDELACAYFCQKIVAVNERDADLIRQAGHSNVAVLGHMQEPAPTPADWSQRAGLLFLGAFHEEDSPNYDSVAWFVDAVLPRLAGRLPPETRFTVAGHTARRVDMTRFARHARVEVIGSVADLAALYDRHRVFVAPTRFAGGIPFKVHEAASHGLPVVASELLCRQVGWTDGREILSGGTDDPARFADRVVSLYEDAALWDTIRAGALARIETEHGRDDYHARLGTILAEMIDRNRPGDS